MSAAAGGAASGAAADAAAADPTKFDPHILVSRFRTCKEHLHDIPIKEFVDGCDEIKKIVYTLGAAFGIASADITEKTGIMMQRRKELEEAAGAGGVAPPQKEGDAGAAAAAAADARPRLTLQYVVDMECKKGVERQNSSKYVSGARSLLRLMWFLDFLGVLIRLLLEDALELKDCATRAYEEALAPHHPWVIRTTIGAAMYFLPSKTSFWHSLAGSDDLSVVKPKLQEFLDLMEPVRVSLWDLYKTRKLTDLP